MSGGLGKSGRIYRTKTHILPFTDHAGQEALMVFSGRETCPLPPLYSFQIYFTHPEVNPGNVQPAELLDALVRDTPLRAYGCPYRLDIHFLPMPGAKVEECDEACTAHYLAEKRVRGDYTRQVEEYETYVNPDDNLPGFVPSYITEKCCDYLRGILYSYQGADWRTEKQLARSISFDPLPEEELGVLADEVKEELGVDGALPPVYVTLQAFQKSDAEFNDSSYIGECMFYLSHDEKNGAGLWREAASCGWSTW